MGNVTVRPLPLSQMACSSQEKFPIAGKEQPCSKKEEEGETVELSADPWEDLRANSPFFKGEFIWEQPVWIC